MSGGGSKQGMAKSFLWEVWGVSRGQVSGLPKDLAQSPGGGGREDQGPPCLQAASCTSFPLPWAQPPVPSLGGMWQEGSRRLAPALLALDLSLIHI